MTLATHAEGAAKQVLTRKLINAVYRNIPFGDKPAQLSYQHHLRLALKASRTSDEFISNLQGALKSAQIVNQGAKQALKSFMSDIQNSAENLQRTDKTSQNLINTSNTPNLTKAQDDIDTPNLAKNTNAKNTQDEAINNNGTQPTQNEVKGENFTMKDAKQTYPYNAFIDIEQALSKELSLPQPQIRASLQYLYDLHPEMFENKRDVYNTIKELLKFHQYAGNSFKDPNLAYIANKNSDNKMSDMAISRQSGGVIHLNKDKDIRKKDMKIFDEPMAGAVNSQQRQQVSVPQMNTSKEHFSSANDAIIPQKPEISKLINELKFAELNKLNSLQIMGKRKLLESKLNIDPTREFGENYAEFYHDGIGAVHKLLTEKQGQVTGAFERKELGDIDLVWGEFDANSNDGWGLVKITAKHPEITPELLDEIVRNGKLENKDGRFSIIKDNFRVGLKSNWMGEPTQNKWIVTAYEVIKDKGGAKSIHTNSITSSGSLAKTFDDIIPQPTQEIKQSTNKHKEAIQATKEAQIV